MIGSQTEKQYLTEFGLRTKILTTMKNIILAVLTSAITSFAAADGSEINQISPPAKVEGGSPERKSTTYTQSKVSTRGVATPVTKAATRSVTTRSASVSRVNLRRPTTTANTQQIQPAQPSNAGGL